LASGPTPRSGAALPARWIFSIGLQVLPHPQNRLTLSRERKDALGIPHPK